MCLATGLPDRAGGFELLVRRIEHLCVEETVTVFNITEFDVIFLSYDEPNAERHWADLIEKAPWAKRVHGVRGFDSAHRACADLSETDWFVTVDADNLVRPEFFDIQVEFNPEREPLRCFSWSGLNVANGLAYGNGGLKLWSKAFVRTMNTHENADDPRKAVDFCWEDNYRQIYRIYSDVWSNGSAYQAFRVGFREGVKLALNRGERVAAEMMRYACCIRSTCATCGYGAASVPISRMASGRCTVRDWRGRTCAIRTGDMPWWPTMTGLKPSGRRYPNSPI